jgi:PDZ domain-containing protein
MSRLSRKFSIYWRILLTSAEITISERGITLTQPATRRKFRPDIMIALLLLLIPLIVTIFFFLPRYYHFTALGKIVSVRDIGLKGSVNFCYVREGITRNLYERWIMGRAIPDAKFELADASVEDDYSDMIETGEESRNETILNAITSAEEQTGESVSQNDQNDFDQKLDELIKETGGYYGDSFGLMLGIGLVEEAQNEDFSKSDTYVIAGTGTMEADHSVGSVGAIHDKLLTAEKFGADYFFVPKDKETFAYWGLSNEEEAEQVSQSLNLKLTIVPVATLEEALQYLRDLNT